MKKTKTTTLIILTVTTILFLTLSTSTTFGSTTNNPQPVIQEIELHDVTELENPEDEDNLEDSIQPSSTETNQLNARQEDQARKYRYDFIINNEGEENWEIEDQDILKHENINLDWSIDLEDGNEEVWYQIEDQNKQRGGNIDQDQLEWDTSNQQTLEPNEQMEASYLFETTQEETELTEQQYFRVEATIEDEENTGSEDTHETEILKIGNLELKIEEPPQDTRLQWYRFFDIKGTLTCTEGECGDITTEPRYNETDTSMTKISETEGDIPFYTEQSNQRECNDLQDSCSFQWNVNATDEPETPYELDIKAEPEFPELSNQNTENRDVTIEYFLIVSDNRNETTFGPVDVNTTNNPAEGNLESPAHEITVDSYSQPVEELYLKTSGMSSYYISGYEIMPENMFYSFENDTSQRNPMNDELTQINQEIGEIEPGSTVDLFYWLDVGTGKVQDYYNGTKTFQAYSER